MKYMKKSTPDIIISIILFIFFGTLLLQVPEIPKVSRGYPFALIIISMIMTAILLIRAILRLKKEDRQETQIVTQAKTIIPYIVLIIAYLLLLPRIGYVLATVLFMILSFIYLRFKSKIGMVVISVVTTVLLYFVFTNFLEVILPFGKWINIAL
ncbi:MAG: tripartite tricarboxylate transporter TctB family protein [Oribacterium sp.]|nr:tripartite tricarboxylate transporter TctB family protein [Oribacterium sp.]